MRVRWTIRGRGYSSGERTSTVEAAFAGDPAGNATKASAARKSASSREGIGRAQHPGARMPLEPDARVVLDRLRRREQDQYRARPHLRARAADELDADAALLVRVAHGEI